MGAKAPSKVNLRRPTYKCESCSKKFLSAQALKSHHYCVHKIKKAPRTVKEKIKLSKLIDKTVKPAKESMLKAVEVPKPTPPRKVATPTASVENVVPIPSGHKKPEYECPKCLKMFTAYFLAYKHIQKMHCVNDMGVKIPPDSPYMIKPVLVEVCPKCTCRIRDKQYHMCVDTRGTSIFGQSCICSGCKQEFTSAQVFDLHVTGLHCEKLDSMFFPTTSEFVKWKEDMESKTNSNYLLLSKHSPKQTLHCSHFVKTNRTNEHGAPILCPSSVVVRAFPRGMQVHFYKQHYGHPCPEYEVPPTYLKYTVSHIMEKCFDNIDTIDMTDDGDIYVQFKKIMDNIVIDAAKLKINHLKILISKALQMAEVVKQYENDDVDESSKPAPVSKTITDEEITKALETYTKDVKEKTGTKVKEVEAPVLRGRPITERVKMYKNKKFKPTIVNTFSLAEETPEAASKMTLTEATEPKSNVQVETPKPDALTQLTMTPRVNLVLTPPPISSFNDSYKEFVNKNLTQAKNTKLKILSKNDINEKAQQVKIVVDSKIVPQAEFKNVNSPDVKTNNINKIDNITAISDIKINNNTGKTNNNTGKTNNNTGKTNNNTGKTNNNTGKTNNNSGKTNNNSGKINHNAIKTNNNADEKINDSSRINNNNTNKTNNSNNNKKKPVDTNVSNKTETSKPNVVLKNKNKTLGIRNRSDRKKKIMKTKIGQFKPSLSPKKPEASTSINTSITKLKPDIEYEVMEQENDCNILILKI